MKKLFESPAFALLLAVFVVIATPLLSTKFRFGRKCAAISDVFYTESGDAAPVAGELRNFCAAAERIAMTAKQNDVPDAEETLSNVDYLRNMLYLQSDNFSVMKSVYKDLLSSTFSLEAALAKMELSEAESETLASAQHDAAAAKAAIDASSFNSTVHSFLKRYQKFPTPTLAGMVGVNMPCAFD